MTPEEREQMKQLCMIIQNEQDQKKFNFLVEELNALFEKKERRMNQAKKDAPLRIASR